MTRSDNDTWDIATSVGATAVMVALARATETNSADPLIRDQFAEPLVSTPELAGVGDQIASMWADSDWTYFFDRFFADAAAAGVRQHVILAAGLDSRAYRLGWPADTIRLRDRHARGVGVRNRHARRPRRPADDAT